MKNLNNFVGSMKRSLRVASWLIIVAALGLTKARNAKTRLLLTNLRPHPLPLDIQCLQQLQQLQRLQQLRQLRQLQRLQQLQCLAPPSPHSLRLRQFHPGPRAFPQHLILILMLL